MNNKERTTIVKYQEVKKTFICDIYYFTTLMTTGTASVNGLL